MSDGGLRTGGAVELSLLHQAPGCAPLRRAGFPAPLGLPLLPSARSAPAAPTPAHTWIGPRPIGDHPSNRPRDKTMPPAGAL